MNKLTLKLIAELAEEYSDYQESHLAMGQCEDMTDLFNQKCKENNIDVSKCCLCDNNGPFHFFSKIGDTYIDFTMRQFDYDSPFPYVSKDINFNNLDIDFEIEGKISIETLL